MNNETSRDRSARSDKTQLDGKAPGPETVLDARARPEAVGSPPPRLQPLPGPLSAEFKVWEELATKGAEADLFVVERLSDGQSFLAKIYRRGISVKILGVGFLVSYLVAGLLLGLVALLFPGTREFLGNEG